MQAYIHGGAYSRGEPLGNDFSDWVGSTNGDKNKQFVAVNFAYRLGLLGNLHSQGQIEEYGMANSALLDARLAIEWVVKHISQFGGDPKQITLAGQSAGGGMVMDQLVMYDGKNPPFQQASPSAIGRHSTFTIAELKARNDRFAQFAGCDFTASTAQGAKDQLKCLQQLPVERLIEAGDKIASDKDENGIDWPAWVPGVDGKTVTEQYTLLFRKNKFADVPLFSEFPRETCSHPEDLS